MVGGKGKTLRRLLAFVFPGLALLLSGCLQGRPAATVCLAADGVACADIVVAADANRAARFAASDLKYHLDRMTGGDFPVVDRPREGRLPIFVGFSGGPLHRAEAFAEQEYAVVVARNRIELAGRDKDDKGTGQPDLFDEQGTMYAVYEFLERDCGVRWLDCSDYGERIPHRPSLEIPLSARRGRPFIGYRGGSFEYKWAPGFWKSGTPEEAAYRKLAFGGKGAEDIRKRSALFLARHRAGGEYMAANHSFYAWYSWYWNTNAANKGLVAYHPDWFAKGYQTKEPPQLCYSNPEVIAQTVAQIRKYFDSPATGRKAKYWGDDNFALEPMDNASFCKCPRCASQYEPDRRAENSEHSTYWFRFVNAVAREIRKSHPDKRLSTLAYMTHEGLPTNLRLEDNVTVFFCLSANRRGFEDPDLVKQFARMRTWRNAYPDQPLAFWLYNLFPLDNANHAGFNCFPGFFAHSAERQYALFKELDARAGVFQCGFDGDVENYMQLEWMVDPDRTADEMLAEYFESYGPAAKPLEEFYRIVESRYCDPSLSKGAQTMATAWGRLGTPDVMARLQDCMDRAEKAGGTPAERARVAMWKLDVWEYMRKGAAKYADCQSSPLPAWRAPRVVEAGGDPDKVDWSALPADRNPFYLSSSRDPAPSAAGAKWAHDGKFLYLELTERCDTSKLKTSPMIAPFDTWEIMVARQPGPPYRYYIGGPDSRVRAASFFEVNFRWNVPAAESGHPTFHAVHKADRSAPDRWTSRWAFPLDHVADRPVAPGETIHVNVSRVVNPEVSGVKPYRISTFTSFVSVHVTDRMGSVVLEE